MHEMRSKNGSLSVVHATCGNCVNIRVGVGHIYLYFIFLSYDILSKPVLGGTTTNRTPFRFCHPSTVVSGYRTGLGNPDEHTILEYLFWSK